MKKKILIAFMGLIFLAGSFLPNEVFATDVDVNIGIGIGIPPPHVVIPAPPAVVMIPGSYVYFAPDVGFQLFFYSGYWYLLQNGYWFWAGDYVGPWYYLPPARIPVAFMHLPPHYYKVRPGYKRIPYDHLRRHWREWEREHYKKEVKDWEKNLHKRWEKDYKGWEKWKGGKPGRGRERHRR